MKQGKKTQTEKKRVIDLPFTPEYPSSCIKKILDSHMYGRNLSLVQYSLIWI